jgi:pyrroloquinoline-quinone synthase
MTDTSQRRRRTVDLLDRIDALIAERHLLKHPFYADWRAGTLPREALQDYAAQYYAFESEFPRFLSMLHARSERRDVRQALLDNLWDEEHGEANHAELWLRFGEGVGTTRERIGAADRHAATTALVETYRELVAEAPLAAGVAAVYAYEAQVPEVAAEKEQGLRDRYGVSDPRALAFFALHSTLDVEHSAAERGMIRALAVTPADEEAAVEGTARILDAWTAFLDDVRAHCPTPVA